MTEKYLKICFKHCAFLQFEIKVWHLEAHLSITIKKKTDFDMIFESLQFSNNCCNLQKLKKKSYFFNKKICFKHRTFPSTESSLDFVFCLKSKFT